MLAWRIARAPYADLAGAGAKRFGGRWNSPGRPLVYAAETAALAVLEVRVHLDLTPDLIPDDYVLIGIDTGTVDVEVVGALPDDPRAFGDEWLREGRTPVLKAPSFIIPESSNVLINPDHPASVVLLIASSRAFRFDERLWHPLSAPLTSA